MLKGISPLLNADVLYAIRAMGHGDEIAIVPRLDPACLALEAHRARAAEHTLRERHHAREREGHQHPSADEVPLVA